MKTRLKKIVLSMTAIVMTFSSFSGCGFNSRSASTASKPSKLSRGRFLLTTFFISMTRITLKKDVSGTVPLTS